jgi:WD40 repeat protein
MESRAEPVPAASVGDSMKFTRVCVMAAVAVTVVLCAAGASSGSGGAAQRIGNALDIANALAVSPDGTRVFVSGDSDGGMKTNYDFATIAYNVQTGKRMWVARYGGPAGGPDGTEAMRLSGDGKRVYVTGGTVGKKTGWDYGTLAYDAATGKRLWVARYNGPAGRADGGEALAVGGDGARVFVTGTSYGGKATHDDYATIAYDAQTGRRLWIARYDGPDHGNEEWPSVAASANGTRVFVSGAGPGVNTEFDYAVIAYDASTGAQLWASRYDGPAHGFDEACSVAVGGDGQRVFASGFTEADEDGSEDATTIALDASTGARLWVASYAGRGNPADGTDVDDRTCSLHVSSDGTKVFGTGFCCGGEESEEDYLTVAYDAATGRQLWAARDDGPAHGYDWAHSLGLSPDGTKVFVSGESEARKPRYTSDYATIAYDAETGTQLWSARYDGPGKTDDWGGPLGVAATGTHVVVTGTSFGKKTRSDYATIAYDAASGHEAWIRRYNGPGIICLVPSVTGHTLPAARAEIRAADCTVGKIIRDPSANATKGRVGWQDPKPGTRLPPRGHVNLGIKP